MGNVNKKVLWLLKLKKQMRNSLKIPWSNETSLVIQTKLYLADFVGQVRVTWPGSLVAYASENHKQKIWTVLPSWYEVATNQFPFIQENSNVLIHYSEK